MREFIVHTFIGFLLIAKYQVAATTTTVEPLITSSLSDSSTSQPSNASSIELPLTIESNPSTSTSIQDRRQSTSTQQSQESASSSQLLTTGTTEQTPIVINLADQTTSIASIGRSSSNATSDDPATSIYDDANLSSTVATSRGTHQNSPSNSSSSSSRIEASASHVVTTPPGTSGVTSSLSPFSSSSPDPSISITTPLPSSVTSSISLVHTGITQNNLNSSTTSLELNTTSSDISTSGVTTSKKTETSTASISSNTVGSTPTSTSRNVSFVDNLNDTTEPTLLFTGSEVPFSIELTVSSAENISDSSTSMGNFSADSEAIQSNNTVAVCKKSEDTTNFLLLIVVVLLSNFLSVILASCIVYKIAGKKRVFYPPSPVRYQYNTRTDRMTTDGGVHLANDEDCKAEELSSKNVTFIQKNSGWCVPLAKQAAEDVSSEDTGV